MANQAASETAAACPAVQTAAGGVEYSALMSASWSGSTLLSMLLCSQPRVAGFGDTYFTIHNNPRDECTCGVRFLDCALRKAIEDYARTNEMPSFAWPQLRPVPMPRFLPPHVAMAWPLRRNATVAIWRAIPVGLRRILFHRWYQETGLMLGALELTGEYDVYFDGCKNLVRIELLRTEYPRLRLIHSVRHPGAFLYHYARYGHGDLERRLAGWLQYQRRAREFLRLVGPDAYMLVKYEDVVSQPAQFLRNIGTFLGLSSVDDSEPVRVDSNRVHILGNRMRETITEVVNMAERWRGRLDPNWERAARDVLGQDEWLTRLYPDG